MVFQRASCLIGGRPGMYEETGPRGLKCLFRKSQAGATQPPSFDDCNCKNDAQDNISVVSTDLGETDVGSVGGSTSFQDIWSSPSGVLATMNFDRMEPLLEVASLHQTDAASFLDAGDAGDAEHVDERELAKAAQAFFKARKQQRAVRPMLTQEDLVAKTEASRPGPTLLAQRLREAPNEE